MAMAMVIGAHIRTQITHIHPEPQLRSDPQFCAPHYQRIAFKFHTQAHQISVSSLPPSFIFKNPNFPPFLRVVSFRKYLIDDLLVASSGRAACYTLLLLFCTFSLS
ncbi:hypothetical protein Csa_013264 [Cucumis sativus]|uniref:Uncharacterized protein n=1 Tax=Cucumis sativus TaxID=3659 RepID=A0A0A0LVL3_CUCSA|nr:hypothetical protein Csa_013264 [Cucumis sativus]